MVNYNLFKSFFDNYLTKDNSNTDKAVTDLPVRVVDVILDQTHPDFKALGRFDAIGAIKCRPLDSYQEEVSDNNNLLIAYPLNSNIKQFPVKHEIVLLQYTVNYTPSLESRLEHSNKLYWKPSIGIWNHPHHNANPDQSQSSEEELSQGLDFNGTLEEAATINPLQPVQGDILIEGRYGQSVRFSGGSSSLTPWTDDTNIGDPITILSNGQIETDQGFKPIFEDINEDFSSIYLTSNHSIYLEPATKMFKSYYDIERPISPSKYKGAQTLINADRVYLNAKKDGVFLNAASNISISSKDLNIDTEDYISIDSKKIYLGEQSVRLRDNSTLRQPVVRGNDLQIWIERLLSSIEELGQSLSDSTLNTYGIVNKGGEQIKLEVQQLKEDFKIVKSKKVFTE